uniref:Pentatricopeptide repeat-containing protein At2g22410, mitochondrial-like n=1 Tax=Nicotiana tabacum TaxID=4097 RepID=A0A1S4BXJ1_TOBAC|nr:PREDICTED: pentatricopeptide repeat-containing protein At2g22410, mitochondrial-like [Nicotiana tabacum]
MISGFAKFGLLYEARRLFNKMPEKGIIQWNALIGGFVQAKRGKEALALFHEMQTMNVKPDEVTMLCLTVSLGTALVDMYAKCGNVEKALQVFHEMPVRNSLTWTAAIGALAVHGNGRDALSYFSKMVDSGLRPDDVTFLGVLSACCHAGLGALFFACRIHGNVEMGGNAVLKLLEFDPGDSGTYVLLANIYVEANMQHNARDIRKMMDERGLEKHLVAAPLKKMENFLSLLLETRHIHDPIRFMKV